jgi:serpin B
MKRIILVFLAVLMALGLFSCVPEASGAVAKSDKARETDPQVNSNSWDTFIKDNNTFALNLYRALQNNEGNLFFSPSSISEALAMAYAGARGQTETDMSKALQFNLLQNELHPAFNLLSRDLAMRGQGAKGKDGEGFRLHIVNATWGQKNYTFLSSYLDTLAINYDAGLRLVDFSGNPEQSRNTINDWISQQTENKIKDLIPSGAIDALTRLVLTNAIYFNAAWAKPFDTALTVPQPFYLISGNPVTVSMINQNTSFKYAESDLYQAVELPYDGQELSMLIILPATGKLSDFESSFKESVLANIISDLKPNEVQLALPKFEFESSLGLKQSLESLGMGDAFSDKADFSGINGAHDLYIQDVLHKAYVSVDEAGTEAAAASAVIIGLSSMPSKTYEMTVNRPFLFLIRDNATGSIIFLGRVLDPTAK